MQFLNTLVWTIALALAPSPLSSRQGYAQQQPPTTSSKAQAPTKGTVEQGIYKNPSIGLEFEPAAPLQLEEPEMKGTPDKDPLVITVAAAADRTLLSGIFSARDVTVFYADALAYYPEEQRNADRYLKKIIQAQDADGFKQVAGAPSDHIEGTKFLRADFVRGAVYEAVLVLTHNKYAFVFIFAGSDVDAVNKLVASTKVKLTP